MNELERTKARALAGLLGEGSPGVECHVRELLVVWLMFQLQQDFEKMLVRRDPPATIAVRASSKSNNLLGEPPQLLRKKADDAKGINFGLVIGLAARTVIELQRRRGQYPSWGTSKSAIFALSATAKLGACSTRMILNDSTCEPVPRTRQ